MLIESDEGVEKIYGGFERIFGIMWGKLLVIWRKRRGRDRMGEIISGHEVEEKEAKGKGNAVETVARAPRRGIYGGLAGLDPTCCESGKYEN